MEATIGLVSYDPMSHTSVRHMWLYAVANQDNTQHRIGRQTHQQKKSQAEEKVK